MTFDGLGPLLDNDGPWQTAQYIGPGSGNDPADPFGLMELVTRIPLRRSGACPGRSCLLHSTEHEHAGRR